MSLSDVPKFQAICLLVMPNSLLPLLTTLYHELSTRIWKDLQDRRVICTHWGNGHKSRPGSYWQSLIMWNGVSKANEAVRCLRDSFTFMTTEVFLPLYKSLIHSHLECTSCMWPPHLTHGTDILKWAEGPAKSHEVGMGNQWSLMPEKTCGPSSPYPEVQKEKGWHCSSL